MPVEALSELRELNELENVQLNQCDITDEGACQLMALDKLKSVGLVGTKITDQAVQVLRIPLVQARTTSSYA